MADIECLSACFTHCMAAAAMGKLALTRYTLQKGKNTVSYWVPHAQEAKCQLTAVHILVHAYIWRFTFRLGSQEMNHTHR